MKDLRTLLALTLWVVLGGNGCSTVHSYRSPHLPSIGGLCPISTEPSLQDAQRAVLDLEMRTAQAQYDLDSARLLERQNTLLQKRSTAKKTGDMKNFSKITDQLQDLDRNLSLAQRRLSYRIQWIDALRISDCWGAKIAQDALDRLR